MLSVYVPQLPNLQNGDVKPHRTTKKLNELIHLAENRVWEIVRSNISFILILS